MDIKKGEMLLSFEGIGNIEELRDIVIKEVEKYKNLAIDNSNIKEAKFLIEELKPTQTQIRKLRAEVNKELKARAKSKLDEIDNVIRLISEVIDPLQKNIDEYKEYKRLERIEKYNEYIAKKNYE